MYNVDSEILFHCCFLTIKINLFDIIKYQFRNNTVYEMKSNIQYFLQIFKERKYWVLCTQKLKDITSSPPLHIIDQKITMSQCLYS